MPRKHRLLDHIVPRVKSGGGGLMVCGFHLGFGIVSLVPVKGNNIQQQFRQLHASNFEQQFGESHCLQ